MSKECIPNCPRIQAEIERVNPDAEMHLALSGVLRACAGTHDNCTGPVTREVDVTRGVFKKRTDTQTTYVCQLPQQLSVGSD